ncbi:MAG: response regulator transcription factor [Bacteroidia bacterium]|nr:response regulator transcription factor [Bacteroidia bacterium]
MNTQKPKVILAESNELFRVSLAAFLRTKTEIDFLAEASTGKALLDILKLKHADIVILDIEISQMDVNSTFDILKKRFPDTRIILFSPTSYLGQMPEFMAKGANCFLVKNCSVETLLKAIKIVKSEGFFFDNATSKVMVDTLIKVKNGSSPFANSDFTDRETEILKKICDGNTNKEIADLLHLSASTIDFHRSRIYSKAKCNNVAQLLKFALKKGIVELA